MWGCVREKWGKTGGRKGRKEGGRKKKKDRRKEEVYICVHANFEDLVLIIQGCFNHYLQAMVSAFDHMILHN